jgi:hypothetical protein
MQAESGRISPKEKDRRGGHPERSIGIFIIFSIAQKYGYVKEEKHVRDLQTNAVPPALP